MGKFQKWIRLLSSLKIMVVCLVLGMILIVLGTLTQVNTGIFYVQKTYFYSFFIYWTSESGAIRLPVFPGGLLVGALLVINLLASFYRFSKASIGVFIIHSALLLLILGEMFTFIFSVESQIALREGEVTNFSESRTQFELAIVNDSFDEYDEVTVFTERDCEENQILKSSSLPFTLYVRKWYPNAMLSFREGKKNPLSIHATEGVGRDINVEPRPLTLKDEQLNIPASFIELRVGPRSLGTWLLSGMLPNEQEVVVEGKKYTFSLRKERYYFPYSIELIKFTHESYPGTQIPSFFSSLIALYDSEGEFQRERLIYMNEPLRLGSKSFYQASFGDKDQLSVLQVVENSSRLFPYIFCGLVTLGLVWQFVYRLFYTRKRGGV